MQIVFDADAEGGAVNASSTIIRFFAEDSARMLTGKQVQVTSW